MVRRSLLEQRQGALDDHLREPLGSARVDSPASGSGPTISAGWHTIVRVWDGQQARQYVDGLRTKTTVVTATGSWTIHRWGWQFTGSEGSMEPTCRSSARSAPPGATL